MSQSPKENHPGDPLNRPVDPGCRRTVCGICVFLAVITLAVFGQTFRYEFVNFDDGTYVYENPVVERGLTLNGIGWAFTHSLAANWHPFTTISHMLDCQFYGLNAGGHHLTNVLLHTAAVILLFLVLREATGALWRSAFVAAVFAIHPLRVESVAWVAERKDVLSGVFFMLTLWAYVHYARRPFSLGRYLLAALSLTLGLMCKPMLVTLPFVLLLLDYWPLNRFAGSASGQKHFSAPWRLLLEKVPLLGLSAGGCVAAVLAQKNALAPVAATTLPFRICNALVSYVIYIGQMFYPTDLAVFHPLTQRGPLWEVALSFVLLLMVFAGVFYWRRKYPYLLVGWLWYLGMLVPVIGLVQVGSQARADRYSYLPQIGLYLALTWVVTELCAGRRYCRPALGGVAAIVIGTLSMDSFIQTSYWRNSETLWTHTLACTSNNGVAHNNLGMALISKGQVDQAIAQYQKALEIQPRSALFHFNLGVAFAQKGQVDKAIEQYQKAVDLQPDYLQARNNLGDALLRTGRTDEAIAQFQEALKIWPNSTILRNNLGCIFLRQGQVRAAMAHFQRTLEIQPNNVDACQYLAWVLATGPEPSIRNGARAVELAQEANQLSGGGDPEIISTLAAAYAEAGRFPEAVTTARQALQLVVTQNNNAAVNALQTQIGLYQAGLPFRDLSLTNALSSESQP